MGIRQNADEHSNSHCKWTGNALNSSQREDSKTCLFRRLHCRQDRLMRRHLRLRGLRFVSKTKQRRHHYSLHPIRRGGVNHQPRNRSAGWKASHSCLQENHLHFAKRHCITVTQNDLQILALNQVMLASMASCNLVVLPSVQS